jgi:hypothetical protein
MGDDIKQGEDRPGDAGGSPNGSGGRAPARTVIAAFGGIRPMAGKLDVPVSTVQGWKERGVIPESRHDEIRAAAASHGIALDDAVLAASAEGPADTPAEPGAPQASASEEPVAETAAGETPAQDDAAAKGEAAPDEEPPALAPPIAAAGTRAGAHPGARHGGRAGWFGGFVLGALVFAVGAGAAVLTKDLWAPAGGAGGDALSEKLAGMESRLASVEKRPAAAELPKDLATTQDITRLEGQIASLSTASATDDLAAEVKDLKARVTSMGANASAGAEAATAVGGLSGEVASLKSTQDTLKSQQDEMRTAIDELKSDKAGEKALLWSAVSALRDALRYAGPFSTQLADVSRLAGDRKEFQDALAELKPLADTGVPSLTDLQRSFPAAARDIVAAGYGASEDGVLGDVLNRVSQVVTVRPVGEVEGDSPGAIVARAEAHVDDGDLAAAIAELKALPEGAGAAAAGWRQQAEQRLTADAAITKLNGLLAGQLAAGG